MLNPILVEGQFWYNSPTAEEIKGFMPFPKVSISRKVNVIARLEFELAFYNLAV